MVMTGDVRNGAAPPAGSAPMPHIDDITAAPRDIDPNQSMGRLLELCEANLASAEMSREFKRPAIALKYYLKASIIAVHIVTNHRDYPSLASQRGGELQRKHNDLLRRIKALYETYDHVKKEVRIDNERSGVTPTVSRPGSSQASVHPGPNGNSHSSPVKSFQVNGSSQAPVNNSPEKTKPPVPHPKPHSLHGNALKNGHSRSNSAASTASDLAARFAGLRGPQALPGQDPRIKTHAFASPPKPAGPRQMPPSQKPDLGLDSSVSSLPKPPDAIYSPARGNMSEESARMPSSTPRGFSRTGSSASGTSTPNGSAQPPSRDYFTPVFTNSFSADPAAMNRPSMDHSSARSSPRPSLDVASREVIEAEELYRVMKEKGSVLIIDVRPREDFDEGHIMSSSTICIEQSILARENLSADDIGDSLVISPIQAQDQPLFEKRGDYDLVVFYDQDSELIPRPPRGQEDQALVSLHRALVHLNYGKELKQPPRLLKGGLEAWIELMGPASLQSTSSASLKTAQLRRGPTGRRKSRYRVAPLKADEVKAWQETLNKEDLASASSPTLYRTTEDFVRRYPAVPVEPENMTSAPAAPIRPEKRVDYQLSHNQRVVGDLPAPLTRPAPAVSRPSHSGLSIETDGKGMYGEQKGIPQQSSGRSAKTMEQTPADSSSFYTGLHNPHNWCYANSVLQSLLACEFGKELTNSDWKRKYVVPKKTNEKIEQPQLLMQILSNLFHWMSSGKFEVMKAGTLMNYSRHVSSQTRAIEKFGDNYQHDAQEFITFLFTHLDDETNSQRHMQGHPAPPNTKNQSVLEAAIEYWGNHLRYQQSMVDRYWRLIELGITRCHTCGNNSYNFNTVTMINPSIGNSDTTLERALTDHIADDVLSDYMCDNCKRPVQATLRFAYPRMPPLLCISFGRFGYTERGSNKSNARITWDLNDLDMAPYFLRPDACHLSRDTDDKAFKGRFGYECFAVIEHMGSSPDSGHYTAYVRDPRTHDPSAWLYCNDSRVDKVRMDNPSERMKVFKDGDRVPYLAFFRRKGGS